MNPFVIVQRNAGFSALLAVLSGLIVGTSAQGLDEWGTYAHSETLECDGGCSLGIYETDGGKEINPASNSVSDSLGSATSMAALDRTNGFSIPNLRTMVTSAGGVGGARTFTIAAEGYTYTGTTPKSFDIDVNLTADVYSAPGGGSGAIYTEIYVFTDEGFIFTNDIGRLLYEIEVPRLDELVWSNDQTGSVNRSDTLNFTLQPGDNIYLYAWQLAWATENGSSVDAMSTLTFQFQDSAGLVAASVPEPASGMSAIMALLTIANIRRRRATRPRPDR